MHYNESNHKGITEVGSTSLDTCSLEGLSCKYYCPRKGDIASHEIGRKELKFFVFSSALPKSFFSFLASLTARGENHRGRVLLEKYRADIDM